MRLEYFGCGTECVGEEEIADNSALIGFDSVVFSDSKNCSTVGPSDSERDSEPGPASLPASSTAALDS